MQESQINDEIYMRRCFDLAKAGRSLVKTNPHVGAIIVKDNKILSEGYHKNFGGPHAEVNAIRSYASKLPAGCKIYVSLEPCSHHGKTPPCADILVENHFEEGIISTIDPNPLVQGRGIQTLEDGGIKVRVGVGRSHGTELLRPFSTQQQLKRPYIILKWAQSRDGYLGLKNERTKISQPITDRLVHKWRSQSNAIMVGSRTVMVDDPQLNNRLYWGESPIRVVIDRNQKITETATIFKEGQRTLYYSKSTRYFDRPHVVSVTISRDDTLLNVLQDLYSRNIGSILIEGGPTLLGQFIMQDLWDEARIITNPNLLGEGIRSPAIQGVIISEWQIDGDLIQYVRP